MPIKVKVDRRRRRADRRFLRHCRRRPGHDQFRLFRRRPDGGARRLQISDRAPTSRRMKARSGRSSSSCRRARSSAPSRPRRWATIRSPFPTVIDAVIKALETGAARARDRRPFRHAFGLRFYRQDGPMARFFGAMTAATAAGAPARRMTAPGRSAPWRMATRASSRSNCRNRCCRSASRSSRCARIPAAPANSAAASASARDTASWRRAICRPISTAPNIRPGACRAARRQSPAASRW